MKKIIYYLTSFYVKILCTLSIMLVIKKVVELSDISFTYLPFCISNIK